MTIFRKDIAALRGLAVLLVVLYHYIPSIFSGGYVGVDVFFVISGYLITQKILNDLRSDTFSLGFFFSLRAARLLPALSFMILACLAAGWFILSPGSLRNLGREAVSASFFFSNLFYARRTSYWDASADSPVLLHTWSLSIEEQYYLIIPILLLIAARFSPRGPAILTYCILVLSIGATILFLDIPDAFLFFLTPFRMSELALGGVLAASMVIRIPDPRLRSFLSFGALLALLYCVIFLDSNDAFPGRAAIISSLSAALLLKLGEAHGASGFDWREVKVLRSLGLISYPVYLWHWPIVVFLERVLSRSATIFELAVCFFITCMIATFSHFRIEMPARSFARRKQLTSIKAGVICWIPVATAGILSYAIYYYEGFPSRISPVILEMQSDDIMDEDYVVCMAIREESALPDGCFFGDREALKKVMFWGDSHAVVYANELSRSTLGGYYQAKLVSKGGCPPLLGVNIFRNGSRNIGCESFLSNAEQFALEYRPDIIILTARWPYYANGSNKLGPAPVRIALSAPKENGTEPLDASAVLALGLENTLAFADSIGSKVIVIGPTPEIRVSPSDCLITRLLLHLDVKVCGRDRMTIDRLLSPANSVLENATQGRIFLPITDLVCDAFDCPVVHDRKLIYRDSNHLDEGGAKIVFPVIEQEIFR